MLSYRNRCTARGLRFGAPYPDTYDDGGWCTEPANSKPGTLQRDYHCPICTGFETFCRARNLPLRRQCMQQDGATAHTAGESLACLQQHFGDRLISCGSEIPFHQDLTAPDAYIWGMLKESVFRSDDPPGNIPELREKIVIFFVCSCNKLCSSACPKI